MRAESRKGVHDDGAAVGGPASFFGAHAAVPPARPLAYVTVLSSDDYLPGLVTLHESLRRVRATHPLAVLIGAAVSASVVESLRSAGIVCIPTQVGVELPEEVRAVNARNDRSHWSNALEKLSVFSLDQYSKIVYLDSDMLIVKNIDHLFARPHMSAVVAGAHFPGNEDWVTLNSGLMVLEPDAQAYSRLPELIPRTAHRRLAVEGALGVGDQDVISEAHPEWALKPELRLPDVYNMFTSYLDYHVRHQGMSWFGAAGIHVLHFIGPEKPWMISNTAVFKWCAWSLRRRCWHEFIAVILYMTHLARARRRYKRHPLGILIASRRRK